MDACLLESDGCLYAESISSWSHLDPQLRGKLDPADIVQQTFLRQRRRRIRSETGDSFFPDPNHNRQFREAVRAALQLIDPASIKQLDDLAHSQP